jgi:hypothetical protein
MASTSATSLSIPVAAPVVSSARVSARRRIDPRAGHALEILGHAIDYLIDEYRHEGMPISSCKAQEEAVKMLMALNRQVYFECPFVPTLSERCYSFLQAHLG